MTQRDDDQMFIERAQKGDLDAYNHLVLKYEERAYKYAFRLTRNPEIAADVVADSFVRVFSALKNFKGQSAFSTWLYRIVTNCYLDKKKKDKAERFVSLDDTVSAGESEVKVQYEDPSDGPDVIAERNEREAVIVKAMDKMPDYQKTMLVMYHVENLSYEEIADVLDLPIGTVKSRLNRARMALRDALAQHTELFHVG